MAGGSCALNLEPIWQFIDLFVIGEQEEATPELIETLVSAIIEASNL
jgi:radical SAM superfamily enzyme YgiQ (UPF0313 family)